MPEAKDDNIRNRIAKINARIAELTEQLEGNYILMEEDGEFDHLIEDNEKISREIEELQNEIAKLIGPIE